MNIIGGAPENKLMECKNQKKKPEPRREKDNYTMVGQIDTSHNRPSAQATEGKRTLAGTLGENGTAGKRDKRPISIFQSQRPAAKLKALLLYIQCIIINS
jgi:hypothetical protein